MVGEVTERLERRSTGAEGGFRRSQEGAPRTMEEVMGVWWCPDQDSPPPFSPPSSLQWPGGVGHPGEQPAGVERGAAASPTVSVWRAGWRLGGENTCLAWEISPKTPQSFLSPWGP